MIDPGSVGDWLQASLMAAALGALAAASRWALRMEETEQATPHAVPLRESTGTATPTPLGPPNLPSYSTPMTRLTRRAAVARKASSPPSAMGRQQP
jgi:hypothetical protein